MKKWGKRKKRVFVCYWLLVATGACIMLLSKTLGAYGLSEEHGLLGVIASVVFLIGVLFFAELGVEIIVRLKKDLTVIIKNWLEGR